MGLVPLTPFFILEYYFKKQTNKKTTLLLKLMKDRRLFFSVVWNHMSDFIWVSVCGTCQSVEAPPIFTAHVRAECLGETSSTRACTVMDTLTRPFSSRMWWGRHSLSCKSKSRERKKTAGEKKESKREREGRNVGAEVETGKRQRRHWV